MPTPRSAVNGNLREKSSLASTNTGKKIRCVLRKICLGSEPAEPHSLSRSTKADENPGTPGSVTPGAIHKLLTLLAPVRQGKDKKRVYLDLGSGSGRVLAAASLIKKTKAKKNKTI
jgi:hypothetical protein